MRQQNNEKSLRAKYLIFIIINHRDESDCNKWKGKQLLRKNMQEEGNQRVRKVKDDLF